jgi:pimeloyl-ACP methyl ester carboxylesterase
VAGTETEGSMQALTRTITADGAGLHVEERGRGEPLVLLHGMTGTGRDFGHLFDLDVLAETYRVIIPDARGHGRSTDSGHPLTFGQMAGDVLAILDALGVGCVRAVGLSMGAKTLLHVASTAPGRVVPDGLHLPVFLAEREAFAQTAISFLRG